MAQTQTGTDPGDDLKFEDALARLETIVEELEGGELSLEQSLRHYEEGMKLSKRLGRTLDEAEKTIERLEQPGAETGEPAARSRRIASPRPSPVPAADDDAGELPF